MPSRCHPADAAPKATNVQTQMNSAAQVLAAIDLAIEHYSERARVTRLPIHKEKVRAQVGLLRHIRREFMNGQREVEPRYQGEMPPFELKLAPHQWKVAESSQSLKSLLMVLSRVVNDGYAYSSFMGTFWSDEATGGKRDYDPELMGQRLAHTESNAAEIELAATSEEGEVQPGAGY